MNEKKQIKVEVISHHYKRDKECIADYAEMSVKVNGKEVARWGDHYHEKGYERSEAFVEALQFVYGTENVLITKTSKADARR